MYNPERTVVFDVECYHNFFQVGFMRVSDRKYFNLWADSYGRGNFDAKRLYRIMSQYTTVGYNSRSYDLPMVCTAINNFDTYELKKYSDHIIKSGLKYWELDVRPPYEWDSIDLIEVNPAIRLSLKELMARLHARTIADLPYHHDDVLTEKQIDDVIAYNKNDLDGTMMALEALHDDIELRYRLGKRYGLDFRSRSDAQMGEAILRYRYESETKKTVYRENRKSFKVNFHYEVPKFIKFKNNQLVELLDTIRDTEFTTNADTGKIIKPKRLDKKTIVLGEMAYTMGVGGLHSTEKARSVVVEPGYRMSDFDVGSMYPKLIVNSGLAPRLYGPAWSKVYDDMRIERIGLKHAVDKYKEAGEHNKAAVAKADSEGLKIALNGGGFGKLGSRYSTQFDPAMLLNTTLTGQLSILMLIEQALEIEGMRVISGNTDGVVFYYPEHLRDELLALCERWEDTCSMELEETEYIGLFNEHVNSYIAIQPDGSIKQKGAYTNPYSGKGSFKGKLTTAPNMYVCSDAVCEYLMYGTPIRDYIYAQTDIRNFVTVSKVNGGCTFRGENLGRVARFYWSTDGEPLFRCNPHPRSGNFAKVPRTGGAKPIMTFDCHGLPDDLDFERYVERAEEMLKNLGYTGEGGLFKKKPEVSLPIWVYL